MGKKQATKKAGEGVDSIGDIEDFGVENTAKSGGISSSEYADLINDQSRSDADVLRSACEFWPNFYAFPGIGNVPKSDVYALLCSSEFRNLALKNRGGSIAFAKEKCYTANNPESVDFGNLGVYFDNLENVYTLNCGGNVVLDARNNEEDKGEVISSSSFSSCEDSSFSSSSSRGGDTTSSSGTTSSKDITTYSSYNTTCATTREKGARLERGADVSAILASIERIIAARDRWIESPEQVITPAFEAIARRESGALAAIVSPSSAVGVAADAILAEIDMRREGLNPRQRFFEAVAELARYAASVAAIPTARAVPNLLQLMRNIERERALCFACGFVVPPASAFEEWQPWFAKLRFEQEFQRVRNSPAFLVPGVYRSTAQLRRLWALAQAENAEQAAQAASRLRGADIDSLIREGLLATEIQHRSGFDIRAITARAAELGLRLEFAPGALLPPAVRAAVASLAQREPTATYESIASRVDSNACRVYAADVERLLANKPPYDQGE